MPNYFHGKVTTSNSIFKNLAGSFEGLTNSDLMDSQVVPISLKISVQNPKKFTNGQNYDGMQRPFMSHIFFMQISSRLNSATSCPFFPTRDVASLDENPNERGNNISAIAPETQALVKFPQDS